MFKVPHFKGKEVESSGSWYSQLVACSQSTIEIGTDFENMEDRIFKEIKSVVTDQPSHRENGLGSLR